MIDAIAALSASVRTSDDDFPGVVSLLGSEWRLAVTFKGDGYSLQQRIDTPDGAKWVPAGGRSPKSLDKIAAKYGAIVPGLAALCAALPDMPETILPDYLAAVRLQAAAFLARDTCRASYARVVARDGSLRIVVGPDGDAYQLQWIRKAEMDADNLPWRLLVQCATLSELRDWTLLNVTGIVGAGPRGRVSGDALIPRWERFSEGLPETPQGGSWAYVPPLPGASPFPSASGSA